MVASPYLDEDKNEHGDKIVRSGHRVLVGQAQEVHDGRTHPQDALQLVSGSLVGTDGADLGLGRWPGGFPQVDLGRKEAFGS